MEEKERRGVGSWSPISTFFREDREASFFFKGFQVLKLNI